ncbi:MAG TPA: outer membrane beta-barrel family protein [Bacteroidales bacterium]|nr:outer membrane beta-barrel family protein [Bacteroidales bacterium]
MKKVFIPLISVFLTLTIAAQPPRPATATPVAIKPGDVRGLIQDSTTRGGIEYATVGLYKSSDSSLVNGVVTDANGAFSFRGIPAGNYYLDASFLGYTRRKVQVNLTAQSPSADLGVVVLHPELTQIGEVQVVAQNQRLEYKVDKKVVNVAQDISSSGGSLVNVLENTPSVDVDVEGNVTLRGSGNFQLLIDGKPSVVQGSEGLQQIPASAVQSLEIITSPSAKYDPDGEAGIINVIMKKQKITGINGVINASIGTRNKYTGDFLLNMKRNKTNYFIGGEFSDQQFLNKGVSERRSISDTTTYTLTNSKGTFARKSMSVKGGFEYSLNDKSTLSLNGTVGTRNFNRDFTSNNRWYTLPASIDSFYLEDNHSGDQDKYYNLNLDYQKRFSEPNHKLEASVYFSAAKESEKEEDNIRKTNDVFVPVDTQTGRTRSRIEHPESELRIELDYTKPVGKAKMEAGFQSRFDQDQADYIYENYLPLGSEWLRDDSISNRLKYLDALQSVYLTWSAPLGKFEYQVGLRSEYDNRTLDQKTTNESFKYEKLHFFPSFFLTRKLGEKNQVQFTYSRRIQRPDERDLNPFREFRGANNVFYGNPALRPEFTNAFELNYQYNIGKGFVSLETYYRSTYDKITELNGLDTISGRQVYTFTRTNADKDHSLGMELMANVDLTKWWSLNLTGNLFRYQLNGQVEGRDVTSTSTTWRTNLNTMFKLKWDTRLQFTTIYNGPSNTLQGERKGFFIANAAIRKELFKKQMTVSLNARDIFSTGKFSFTSQGSTFYTKNTFRRESPVIMLNLSWRLNNYKQSGNRRDNGGQEGGGGMDEMM